MQQYFYSGIINDSKVILDEDQNHHIKNVLRMKPNTAVRVVDTKKHLYIGKIAYTPNVEIHQLERKTEIVELPIQITLVAAFIKKDKWDFLLQKACELGVYQIVGLNSKHCVVKLTKEDTKKLERFNKITLEACEQARRTHAVEVVDIISLKQLKQYMSECNVVAYEKFEKTTPHLKHVLQNQKSITIVIGPEGGFDVNEIQQMEALGFQCVQLGKRILRAETAAMSAIHTVSLHFE